MHYLFTESSTWSCSPVEIWGCESMKLGLHAIGELLRCERIPSLEDSGSKRNMLLVYMTVVEDARHLKGASCAIRASNRHSDCLTSGRSVCAVEVPMGVAISGSNIGDVGDAQLTYSAHFHIFLLFCSSRPFCPFTCSILPGSLMLYRSPIL